MYSENKRKSIFAKLLILEVQNQPIYTERLFDLEVMLASNFELNPLKDKYIKRFSENLKTFSEKEQEKQDLLQEYVALGEK